MRNRKVLVICITFIFTFGLVLSAAAAPQQEAEAPEDTPEGEAQVEDIPKIGIVYRTVGSAYMFRDIQYQSFYLAEQKLWKELAEEENFEIVEMEGGVLAAGGVSAVDALIGKEVDGIAFCFCDPQGVASGIIRAQEKGIPIVATGMRPPVEAETPFVGFAQEAIGIELGIKTANLFKEEFPDKNARILIANNTSLSFNKEKEDGFVEGFQSVLSSAEVVEKTEDDGTVRNASNRISTALIGNPDINVFFTTSDLRAFGALSALKKDMPDRLDEIILASTGGGNRAFSEMMDPGSPWRVEAAYLLKDFVERSWSVLEEMIKGEKEINSDEEYLISAKVFVEPSLSELEKFLQNHHKIDQLEY